MNPLHEDTLKHIEILFPKNLQPQIIDALLNDCAKGILPSTLEELELEISTHTATRRRFAEQ